MKVIVRDSQILKTIEPNVLKEHLQERGWYEDSPFLDNATIWLWKNGEKDEYEILLPLKQSLGDYAARMSEALKTLEVVEGRSQLDILRDLLTSLPNIAIQGIVTKVEVENNQVTVMGVVAGKLRKIRVDLDGPEYDLAVKAYQERVPVVVTGDFIKEGDAFVLKNPRNFGLDDAWTV